MVEAPSEVREAAKRGEEVRDALLEKGFGKDRKAVLKGVRDIESVLDENFRNRSYFQMSDAARNAWNRATAGMDAERRNIWGAILLSDLIAQAPRRMSDYPPPEAELPHITREFARILNGLERKPSAPRGIEHGLFRKDLGICRLDVFPCVAQIVAKNSGIPRSLAAAEFFRSPLALVSIGLKTRLGFRPFFEMHTHTPMLRGFTPEGWARCYALVGELLKAYPEYQGVISASWFYDPELDRVSPRLSYLRERPVNAGAFLLRAGQNQEDIANATYMSHTRRELYQSGQYQPTRWFLIWPRASLLNWVAANRDSICTTAPGSE